MNQNKLDAISKGELEFKQLTEKEKEVALKILTNLEGTLVIRATSILELCLKAIQYSKVN